MAEHRYVMCVEANATVGKKNRLTVQVENPSE